MIIWAGHGYLVAVVTFASCLMFNLVLDRFWGEGYYSNHNWAIGTALILGGVISSLVGYLLMMRHDRTLIDEETGERFRVNLSHHTFFFIPMHWAGIAIAVIGAICIVSDFV